MYLRKLYLFILLGGLISLSCEKLVNDPGDVPTDPESDNGLNYWGGVYDDFGHAVVQTADGGYAVVGSQYTIDTLQQDLKLVIFNEKLNLESQKVLNISYNNIARDLKQTNDGGYILVGSTFNGSDYDVWIVKFDSQLDTTWSDTVRGAYDDIGNSVVQTEDGGFIVCGNKFDGNDNDIVLWKFAYDGTAPSYSIIWSEDSLDTPDNGANDYGKYAHQTNDGGYIIVGSSFSATNASETRLIKLDSNGDTLSTNGGFYKTFNNSSGYLDDEGIFVQQTIDNGYVVVGNYSTGGWGQKNIFVLKTDHEGTQTYLNTYGGQYPDAAANVRQTDEGGFIIVGNFYKQSTMDDIWVIKLTHDGSTEWENTYGGDNKDIGTSINQTTDGGYIITGNTYSYGNQSEVFLLKIESDGEIINFENSNANGN